MIRVILESSSGVVAEAGRADNESYLCQSDESRFPYLSQIDCYSYACFAPADMDGLLAELIALGPEFADQLSDVIALVTRCKNGVGMVLSFTPFDQ